MTILTKMNVLIILSISIIGALLYLCMNVYLIKKQLKKSEMKINDSRIITEPHNTTTVHLGDTSCIENISNQLSELDDINLNPNDKHNVHNVAIINRIYQGIDQLNKFNYQCNISDSIKQIAKLIEQNSNKYEYMTIVWKFINKHRSKYSSRNIPECDIINLIWGRINCEANKDYCDTLKEEFLYQLNDCFQIDDMSVCCLEGRIIRYFQVLELYDYDKDNWTLVPMWYIKHEIQNYCANALNKMINSLSTEEQQLYVKINPTPDDSLIVLKWNDVLIDELTIYFNEHYGHLLNNNQLQQITIPCFSAIKDN